MMISTSILVTQELLISFPFFFGQIDVTSFPQYVPFASFSPQSGTLGFLSSMVSFS